MKKVLIGAMVILSLGIVGCSSTEKKIELTGENIEKILENREVTYDEYKAIAQYYAQKLYDITETKKKDILDCSDAKELLDIITNYRDNLMELDDEISAKVFTRRIKEDGEYPKNDIQPKLKETIDYYTSSLTYEIHYIKDNNKSDLEKSKLELEKAHEKYEQIMSL